MAQASVCSLGPPVIARDGNILRVDFGPRPEPPNPVFPGAGALRPALLETAAEFVTACGRPADGRAAGFAAA